MSVLSAEHTVALAFNLIALPYSNEGLLFDYCVRSGRMQSNLCLCYQMRDSVGRNGRTTIMVTDVGAQFVLSVWYGHAVRNMLLATVSNAYL